MSRYTNKRTGAETVALDDTSFIVGSGEFVCIVGPSGCGKTTFLSVVDGLITATGGRIIVDGVAVLAGASTVPEYRRRGAQLALLDRRLRDAGEVLKTPATRVILAGRVPSWAIAQMEQSVQCWTRVYSEERGMRAAGRLGAGQVHSLLNDHLRAVGLSRFIADLCSMADTMLWDTRVLWAANGIWPSEEDRYAADLGLVDAISNLFIREFTQAVLDAPIPIVTGGHALVSGGLWTLLESINNDQ